MRSLPKKAIILSVFTFISTFANLANAQDLVALELYWNPQRKDNFVTATPEGGNSALEAGYTFVRVEVKHVFSVHSNQGQSR